MLGVIGSLYPEELPAHGKRHKTHDVNWILYATLDHIHPGSTGGHWLDPSNLVTTCWLCNGRKSNLSLEQLGWTLQSTRTDWDGMIGAYAALWNAAGSPKVAYHRTWFRAFEKAREQPLPSLDA